MSLYFLKNTVSIGSQKNVVDDYTWQLCLEASKKICHQIQENPEEFSEDFPKGLEIIAELLFNLVKNGHLVIEGEQTAEGVLFSLVKQ